MRSSWATGRVLALATLLGVSGLAIAGASDDDGKDKVKVRKVYAPTYVISDDRDTRGFLGVQVEEEVELESGGARIDHVVPDSPADRAGLEDGDVIVELDGSTIRGPGGLTQALGKTEPGDRVKVEVVRDGRRETVTAELGERPRMHVWSSGEGFGWVHRPLLGVELVGVTPDLREHLGADRDRGVLVGRVTEDSAAEKAGIQVGDLIVGVEDDEIEDAGDLREALRSRAGESVRIDLVRDGRSTQVRAELPGREDTPGASYRRSAGEAHGAYVSALRAANEARRDAMRGVREQYREALAAYRQARPANRWRDVTLY